MIDLKILVQTLPDKPTSPNQKYETKNDIVKIIKNMHKPLTDEKEAQAELKKKPRMREKEAQAGRKKAQAERIGEKLGGKLGRKLCPKDYPKTTQKLSKNYPMRISESRFS